jgi:hypothetical protein
VAQVKIIGSGYPVDYEYLNTTGFVNLTILDFIRAALTIGAKDLDEFHSWDWRELTRRWGMTLNAIPMLDFSDHHLKLHPAFSNLDMTEKGSTSYNLGMLTTKLISEKLLDIPWLMHVDRLLAEGRLTLGTHGKTRSDLAGLDLKGNWHVLEAKGRSGGISQNDTDKAKSQARNVRLVNRRPPKTATASIAQFAWDSVEVSLLDPPSTEGEGQTWDITIKEYLEAYYRPIIDFIEVYQDKAQTREFQPGFQTASFIIFNNEFVIGIREETYGQPDAALDVGFDWIPEFKKSGEEIRGSNYPFSLGTDGVLVMSQGRFDWE